MIVDNNTTTRFSFLATSMEKYANPITLIAITAIALGIVCRCLFLKYGRVHRVDDIQRPKATFSLALTSYGLRRRNVGLPSKTEASDGSGSSAFHAAAESKHLSTALPVGAAAGQPKEGISYKEQRGIRILIKHLYKTDPTRDDDFNVACQWLGLNANIISTMPRDFDPRKQWFLSKLSAPQKQFFLAELKAFEINRTRTI